MGYKAEKEKVEKRIKILKRVLLGVLVTILLALCIFCSFVPPSSWKYRVGLPNIKERKAGELRIHFIDVGQGDCTLIELPDGKKMLIDGGDGSARATKSMLRYLNALKIDRLDYLVVTHADKDHCGGLDVLLKYKEVLVAYLPPSFLDTDTEYAEFYSALVKTKAKRIYSSRSVVDLGMDSKGTAYPYTLSFLSPYIEEVNSAIETPEDADFNALSAVLWLDYKGTSALFTGDIPSETEEALLRDARWGILETRGVDLSDTEILKVAHHGSASSTSASFLEYLGVEAAVISCGEGNVYGHPAQALLGRLDSAQVAIWRTDIHGHVIATVSADGSYNLKSVK